jgi:hypothetical protein
VRRDLNWKAKREDGTSYDVRVIFFSKEFKFQFRDKGEEKWDHKRKPSLADVETFTETIRRYYPRRVATAAELVLAEKMLKDAQREHALDSP